MTNDDEKLFDKDQVSPLIRLNIEKEYVAQNLMVDVKGCERLTEGTRVPINAIFVDYKYVRKEILLYLMPIILPEDYLELDDVPETGLLSKITNKVKRLFDFFE